MRTTHLTVYVLCAFLLLAPTLGVARSLAEATPQKKEYLSDAEADKIRDAGVTGPRIVLYATFAADRIKKLQYEFAHLDPADDKRTDRLNSLINGYSGCIDDAADLLDLGIEKQEDIREGVKILQARLKEFLPYLQELASKGPELDTYKDNLEDAIEATQDAQKEVEKAGQEMAPPPVRRKPS
jgi:chromosome segregation ATPase